MIKLISTFLALVATCHARPIIVQWDPNSEPEVTSYAIYRSTLDDGAYELVSVVSQASDTIEAETGEAIVVTARTDAGAESLPSAKVVIPAQASSTGKATVTGSVSTTTLRVGN